LIFLSDRLLGFLGFAAVFPCVTVNLGLK